MNDVQLKYAILNIKFPKGYRTVAGAKFKVKLDYMNIHELKQLYSKLKGK